MNMLWFTMFLMLFPMLNRGPNWASVGGGHFWLPIIPYIVLYFFSWEHVGEHFENFGNPLGS